MTETMLQVRGGEATVATDHAECPICFEPMISAPSCVLLDSSDKRVCQHLYHLHCAQAHQQSQLGITNCPICRGAFSSLLEIPDFNADPTGWFQSADLDGDGQLSISETTEILKTVLPLNWRHAEQWIRQEWNQWDTDGDGRLSYSEITRPRTGLLACLRAENFSLLRRDLPPEMEESNLREWFAYSDEDESGELDREEVVRALINTLGVGQDFERQTSIREAVNGVWGVFDTDGSGAFAG
mmetsp:Transcript_20050/g.29315  ORF Transcript_20050/g.29315 Transcript_20050/m.29315 type:complete len:241 (-) Transcript_20050:82-804(-)